MKESDEVRGMTIQELVDTYVGEENISGVFILAGLNPEKKLGELDEGTRFALIREILQARRHDTVAELQRSMAVQSKEMVLAAFFSAIAALLAFFTAFKAYGVLR